MSNVVTHKFTITYEAKIDTDTGEILETKIVSKSPIKETSSKKEVEDTDTEPKIVLEGNKYHLNNAAINLMGIAVGDKLDIKYEDGKGGSVPVIGTDEAFGTKSGCKLTKSNTVSCRGSKNEELSKYGSEFKLVPHPSKDGLFVLTTDTIKAEQLIGDDNIKEEGGEDEEVPFDLNVDEIDGKDANVEEIDSKYFQL